MKPWQGEGVIASLPMYHRPELVDAHDRYWTLIRQNLAHADIPSPTDLTRGSDEFETWRDPTLVLSQTCGMPYRNSLHGHVTLIGTPDFGLDGCEPGWGRSAFVVRSDDARSSIEDFAGAVFAYNQAHSQSGYASPYRHVDKLGFWFTQRHRSGQHLNSARAVADGTADIAAIDAVTWRLIERHEPVAPQLQVIDYTEPTPWLPYISRAGAPQPVLFDAVAQAIADLTTADRDSLGLYGFAHIPAAEYLAVPNPPDSVTASL